VGIQGMNVEAFNYDVAFSFLSADEPLAAQLNDILQDRLRTFLYSKRQGEVAGGDGEEIFNKVFAEQARLVIVLYRKGWGDTPWTRIEQTAIRKRGYEHGYEFAKFIPLDEPPSVPRWLPPTQTWIGLKRYGVEAAAAVIEARVQELGGQPKEESVLDRAERLDRQAKFDKRREQFRRSEPAVERAKQEVLKLGEALETTIKAINAKTSLRLAIIRDRRLITVTGLQRGLSIYWECHYANSLDGSALEVSLWDGHPPMPGGFFPLGEPNKIRTLKFDFDLLPTDTTTWIPTADRKRAYSTGDLANHILKFYMDNGRG
jgi:hypothetical protein